MEFRGVLGEDAPDPRLRWRDEARRMPVPFYGLVPQRHLEDWDAIGVGWGTQYGSLASCEVSVGYTLWRDPDNPDSPDNRDNSAFSDEPPPWPRPAWLVEQVRRMRYPMLWECVRTSWSREPAPVPPALVAHVNHILANRFDGAPEVHGRCVEPGIPVTVDGTARAGFRIDTDPYVYGLGVPLDAHTVLTAVIPRDALPYVDIRFAQRPV